MSFEIDGLKELQNKLEAITNSVQEIDGREIIPFVKIFTPSFLASCSNFTSVEELFSASGFKVNTQEDLEAIPDVEWNSFISDNTSYQNWAEMLNAAVNQWAKEL